MYTGKVAEPAEAIEFDWDAANVPHIGRHGVKPEEAEEVLRNDPFDFDYEVIGGESRWTSLGHTDKLRILVVVWTMWGDAVRVVSAWPASRNARRAYLRRKGL